MDNYDERRTKVVSIRLYPETWEQLDTLARKQGMTKNSLLNMILFEYINSKKDLLKEKKD